MARRRLLWQLFPSYLLITLVALLAGVWYACSARYHCYYERVSLGLAATARLVGRQVEGRLPSADQEELHRLCDELAETAQARVTITMPSGKVVADSENDPASMDNHGDRPEIVAALKGEVGMARRRSSMRGKETVYVAVPVRESGRVAGVVRTALPVSGFKGTLTSARSRALSAALVIACLAAAVCLAVSRRISRPLEEMGAGAERFARGELGHKLPIPDSAEMASLAETLNEMAAQLDERIRTVTTQRNEKEAILSSMEEGVLAVDSEARVISLNHALARRFGVEEQKARGRSIQEVVRNTDVQEFVRAVLAADQPVAADIAVEGAEQMFLQAHGTPLRDAQGEKIGALVVLNDVTNLQRLENVRREFVANVSHELRTPITAIKGFTESLLDGALDDAKDTERFLRIITGQTDRLNAIIEDLLALSRLEQGTEQRDVILEDGLLCDVLETSINVCRTQAEKKNITIQSSCDRPILARINPPLLEQALVNLIENAIRYSSEGSAIEVTAADTGEEVTISVRDEGCGIAAEHLPRIFERFYRLEKARSREAGGTGLGLAIVEHIAQAHGGRVSVESKLGSGSTFFVHLPKP